MRDDRSTERRHFAAECLALARQTADLNARAALIAMAQKWLELADEQHGTHAFNNLWRRFNEQQLLVGD
jgi:hypothetical protein